MEAANDSFDGDADAFDAANMRGLMEAANDSFDGDADASVAAFFSFQSHHATLTLPAPDDDPATAERRLREEVDRFVAGITYSTAGRSVTLESDSRTIEGIGDEAYWLEDRGELRVRVGAQRMAVRVALGTDVERNLQATKTLAQALASEF